MQFVGIFVAKSRIVGILAQEVLPCSAVSFSDKCHYRIEKNLKIRTDTFLGVCGLALYSL